MSERAYQEYGTVGETKRISVVGLGYVDNWPGGQRG